jgi:hypothetical protein
MTAGRESVGGEGADANLPGPVPAPTVDHGRGPDVAVGAGDPTKVGVTDAGAVRNRGNLRRRATGRDAPDGRVAHIGAIRYHPSPHEASCCDDSPVGSSPSPSSCPSWTSRSSPSSSGLTSSAAAQAHAAFFRCGRHAPRPPPRPLRLAVGPAPHKRKQTLTQRRNLRITRVLAISHARPLASTRSCSRSRKRGVKTTPSMGDRSNRGSSFAPPLFDLLAQLDPALEHQLTAPRLRRCEGRDASQQRHPFARHRPRSSRSTPVNQRLTQQRRGLGLHQSDLAHALRCRRLGRRRPHHHLGAPRTRHP